VVRLSENALKVLEARYLRKDAKGNPIEGPEDMFRRVARHVAKAEGIFSPRKEAQRAKEFFQLMASLKFLPNSPTLMNAGRRLGQLAACFVLPVEDSLTSIFGSLKRAAIIHQSGGGTGFSFSSLRPRGDMVSTTHGVASGPVSFMRVFDMATEVIKQGGTRRGANMGVLRVDHPDIREFITLKRDPREMNTFNLSVAITEGFMRALQRGEDFPLVNPRTGRVFTKVNARELFELMVECAWESGEPGALFLDRINRANPTPALGEIEATNPCVTGDTWVTTSEGPARVKELVGRSCRLLLDGRFYSSGQEGFFYTGRKRVLEVRTKRGYRFKATPDHLVRVVTSMGRQRIETSWKPVGELKAGDILLLSADRGSRWDGKGSFGEGYLLGLLMGDGTLKGKEAILSIWGDGTGPEAVRAEAERFAYELPRRADFQGFQKKIAGRGEYRLKLKALKLLANHYGLNKGSRGLPATLEMTSWDFHRGFLRGFLDAHGSVQGHQDKGVSVRLAQSDLELLIGVQRMLLRLGIASTIYENRRPEASKELPNGKGGLKQYRTKAQHELVISGDNLRTFAEVVGFADTEKQRKLEERLKAYRRAPNRERFVAEVQEVIPQGESEVFDVRVPGCGAFSANGVWVHNCGEQPLLPNEACNLGSINLVKMLKRGPRGYEIDWRELRETVKLAVRFLDDVVEVNRYPFRAIERICRGNRKIGLGVMGFAHMLILLHIPYHSDGAVKMAEELMAFIHEVALEASRELAAERGPFPNFSKSLYAQKGEPPRRNATLTTIAPTGTLSIIADCSAGIEPLFALAYTKRMLGDVEVFTIDPVFLQVAEEEGFLSPELKEEVRKRGQLSPELPVPERYKELFLTAFQIPPWRHIQIQAAFQRHTDNAVSKTINFPAETPPEKVGEAFLLAYELGCKGITVYRSGSREGQVITCGLSQLC